MYIHTQHIYYAHTHTHLQATAQDEQGLSVLIMHMHAHTHTHLRATAQDERGLSVLSETNPFQSARGTMYLWCMYAYT